MMKKVHLAIASLLLVLLTGCKDETPEVVLGTAFKALQSKDSAHFLQLTTGRAQLLYSTPASPDLPNPIDELKERLEGFKDFQIPRQDPAKGIPIGSSKTKIGFIFDITGVAAGARQRVLTATVVCSQHLTTECWWEERDRDCFPELQVITFDCRIENLDY